jgi:hypothetical protein
MPANPGMYWWKNLRGAGTDLLYWFVVPLFVRLGRTVLLVVGLSVLFGAPEPHPLPVHTLPLWVQCAAILVIQDVLLYVLHRAFHSRWAWGFHAVHHSPRVLDWMATVRFHPVNQLLEFGVADVAVLLLGFSPTALLVLTPFNLIYSAMVRGPRQELRLDLPRPRPAVRHLLHAAGAAAGGVRHGRSGLPGRLAGTTAPPLAAAGRGPVATAGGGRAAPAGDHAVHAGRRGGDQPARRADLSAGAADGVRPATAAGGCPGDAPSPRGGGDE